MASILVVGQEQHSLERFHRVLSAEGWRVRVAQGRAQALQAAALEPPDLVVAGAEMAGAEELATAFRRSAGGPGILIVMTEVGSPTGPALLGDERLRQPFGDQDLVAAVRRMLTAGRGTARTTSLEQLPQTVRLTSQEIFGDVLAEVEGQFGSSVPGQAPPPAIPSPAPAGSAQPSRIATARSGDDVQQKLEKTLSGLLGGDPRASRTAGPAARGTAPQPRRPDAGSAAADVEAMLSRTLSELGARPRPAGAAPAAAAAPASPAASAGPAGAAGAGPLPAPGAGPLPAPAAAPAAGTARVPPSYAPEVPAPARVSPPLPSPPAPPAPPEIAAGPAAAAATAPLPTAAAPSRGAAGGPTPAVFAMPAAGVSAAAAVTTAAIRPVAAAPRPSSPGAPAPPLSPAPPSPVSAGPQPVASPPPLSPPASSSTAEGTGVRRRLTGELDLSQIEEMARTRRRVDPASRPGLAGSAPPVAAAGAATPAPAQPIPFAPGRGESPAATQRIQMVPREQRATAEPAGERFGQYTLLERIAVGGMAEVWKARMRGVEGFQKTVAIKKILPYMTDNAEFVGMFIDEAKLAAQLSHHNIIHIYDLGKIGSDFYIAMEYVDGKDLRSLLNAARQRGTPLPLGLALLIGVRLASALDYAHRKRDFEGREMGLVHRDVSPQNVLISYDGDVKLCDFGIAKAVSKAGQTQMGALKGKLQYMSPEQARGSLVDARSDIFSLGTVLFEMLTGQRLFDGDSEMSVLEAVRQVKVRSPRLVDPAIPQEVDEIVMHALAGRPEDRFQTAGELEQRLEGLLFALKPSPSHSDLAAFVRLALAAPAGAAPADRPQPASAAGVTTPSSRSGVQAPALVPPTRTPPPPFAPLPRVAAPPPAAAIPAPAVAPAPVPSFPQSPAAAGAQPQEVAPLLPLGEVRADEAWRPVRLLLVAAVVVLALATLLYFFVGRRKAANPAAAGATAAANPAAAGGTAGNGAATPAPAGTAGVAGALPGQAPAPGSAAAGKAAPGKVDVQGVVDQEVARRADEMKKKLEQQQQQLQKEIDKAKAAKPDNAGATAANPPGSPAAASSPPSSAAGADSAARAQKPAAAPAASAADAAAGPAPAGAASSAVQQEATRDRTAEPAARAAGEAPAAPPAAVAGASSAAGAGGGAMVPPKLVSTPKPEYPPLARRLGVEGVVVLSVLVNEQGGVEDVQVVQPISENVGINEAAVQVARSARFKPATRDGVRVKMWTRLRIPFKR
ncbi:MAG TPA: TonB family protein [Thermoanaerobaculia bacterium]|nr:TonB family protein [Thermoanaerobaculia bacterium]